MTKSGLCAGMMLLTLAMGCDAGTSATAAGQAAGPQQDAWPPSGGQVDIPLWPKGLALAKPDLTGPEIVHRGTNSIAGRPVTWVENVERPTMTVYPAKGANTRAAVLVFPGGGYRALAIDLEGTEVCDWLTPKGITCVVLKYRVPGSAHHWDNGCKCHKTPKVPMALQDAQRAMTLLRHRANELAIDPHKIGVLGFSAGGHLVAAVTNTETLRYAPVDAADALSSRPDFGVSLYPGHLWDGPALALHPRNPISKNAPPTFILQAEDDPVDDVRNAIVYFSALREAGVPAEMHLYAHGGHAFGLRPTPHPIGQWPALVETWLHTIGIL